MRSALVAVGVFYALLILMLVGLAVASTYT